MLTTGTELAQVIDHSARNVFSALHICWGAQAGLYQRYEIGKISLEHQTSIQIRQKKDKKRQGGGKDEV
jgi:homoserine O-succinyltransferase